MQVGVVLPHTGRVVDETRGLADIASAAGELGFSSLWAGDHIALPESWESSYPYGMGGQYPVPGDRKFVDGFLTLAYVAAITTGIKLGMTVCIAPYRRPAVLAKTVGSLDHLARGRFILGVGVGWLAEEFEALAVPFETRGQATDEALAFLRKLWSTDGAVPVQTKDGEIRMHIEPRGFRPEGTEIWVGGQGRRAMRRAARYADSWHPTMFDAEPEALAQRHREVREEARSLGREPVGLTLFLPYHLRRDVPGEDPWISGHAAGPVEWLADVMRTYRSVGVDHVVLACGGSISTRISVMQGLAGHLKELAA